MREVGAALSYSLRWFAAVVVGFVVAFIIERLLVEVLYPSEVVPGEGRVVIFIVGISAGLVAIRFVRRRWIPRRPFNLDDEL